MRLLGNIANISILSASFIGLTLVGGCGKKKDKDKATTVSVNALNLSTSPTLNVAGNTPDSLKSLKYMIRSIDVCEDLEINGTRWSNATNCSTVYDGKFSEAVDAGKLPKAFMDSTNDVAFSAIDELQEGKYAEFQIDLMDKASREKLNTQAEVKVGTYKYAVINWASPIQFNVEVDEGGTKIYSKNTTSIGETSADKSKSFTTHDMLQGPAEDGVVVSPNGGTFFRFPKPFVISEKDADDKVEFVIDLVFNPDSVIRASADAAQFSMTSFFKGETAGMYVPMLSLAPVPRKKADTNKKEVYEITALEGEDTHKFRLELYYNESDSSKSIMGVSLVKMTGLMSDDAKIVEIEDVDGKLKLIGAAGVDGDSGALSGFERGTDCKAATVHTFTVEKCAHVETVDVK